MEEIYDRWNYCERKWSLSAGKFTLPRPWKASHLASLIVLKPMLQHPLPEVVHLLLVSLPALRRLKTFDGALYKSSVTKPTVDCPA